MDESTSDGEERMNTFTRESVAAVFAMTNAADLEARIKVLNERIDVSDDRLIPFFVVIPDMYDLEETQTWVKNVNEALEGVAKDAHQSIMIDRTLKTMIDLGLGDDGDGHRRD